MSNLLSRVLVAVVGIPLLVWLCLTGSWPFAIFAATVSALGAREFYNLSVTKAAHPQGLLGSIAAFALPLSVYNDHLLTRSYTPALLLCIMVAVMGLELWRRMPHPLINVSVTLGALAYCSLGVCSLVLVRNFHIPDTSGLALLQFHSEWQGFLLLCTFITVWSGDSAAYFAGLAFGKHKIFPRVSPKKSWEGSIAGFIFSTVAMLAATHFLLPEFRVVDATVLGALIGIIGPIGDFSESLLKRDAAIKDSSALIPGHGGILDRFDSLLFVGPLVYCYLVFVS